MVVTTKDGRTYRFQKEKGILYFFDTNKYFPCTPEVPICVGNQLRVFYYNTLGEEKFYRSATQIQLIKL